MNKNIIFLHGIYGSQDNFYRLMKHFPGSQSFDLVGFGREVKPNATYNKDYFLEFLERKITTPSIIVGHSMGAILAKEFALKHPGLVERIYAIGYPLQKSQEKMDSIIRKNKFMSLYLDGNIFAKIACYSDSYYRYILIPFGLIFYHGYFLSFWHYFSHTYNSASSSIINIILRDDYKSIHPIRRKIAFITGENDCYTDKSIIKEYKHFEIEKMGHSFFGYEEVIANIIKRDTRCESHYI